MPSRRYLRKNRYKFKRVSFKLTYKQKDLVDRCSRLKNTTPNKLIKTAIREYLDKYSGMLEEDSYISENQLSLFDKGSLGEQMTIFDSTEKED